jgi:hypothetical protein
MSTPGVVNLSAPGGTGSGESEVRDADPGDPYGIGGATGPDPNFANGGDADPGDPYGIGGASGPDPSFAEGTSNFGGGGSGSGSGSSTGGGGSSTSGGKSGNGSKPGVGAAASASSSVGALSQATSTTTKAGSKGPEGDLALTGVNLLRDVQIGSAMILGGWVLTRWRSRGASSTPHPPHRSFEDGTAHGE